MYTVGHSSRGEKELVALLCSHEIRYLADVRRFPGSRRHPQFSRENLEDLLSDHGMSYVPLGKELGGFRKGGYEEHMKTESFREGVDRLVAYAHKGRTAVLCAEALFLRCHRRFIADALVQEGARVVHILSCGRDLDHEEVPRQKSLPL